jgi:hypothetical protein
MLNQVLSKALVYIGKHMHFYSLQGIRSRYIRTVYFYVYNGWENGVGIYIYILLLFKLTDLILGIRSEVV